MNPAQQLAPLGRCGRYTLLRRIAQGGMGEIFVARDDEHHGRTVAVKRMLPEAASDPVFVGMFQDEARVTAGLDHENIAAVYEFGEAGSSYFLAMEWIDGASLLEILDASKERQRPLSIPIVVQLIAGAAAALDYAHRQVAPDGHPMDLVHRDVSPANIMVTLDGVPKLLDFGMAKARTQLEKTQAGFVKGKFGYLAPEQLLGKVDSRTDLFALGLCLFEMLTGRQLFEHGTAVQTVMAIQNYKSAPSMREFRPDVPPALDAVVKRALEPDPQGRFQDGEAMKKALLESIGAWMGDTDQVGQLVQEYFHERIPVDYGKRLQSERPDRVSHAPEREDEPTSRIRRRPEPTSAQRRRNGLIIEAVTMICLVAAAAISGAIVASRFLGP